MKLAKVKVEYSCGTTIDDRVTLDEETGRVHLPPRLQALLHLMEATECSPSFVLEYNGSTLPVTVDTGGLRKIGVPVQPRSRVEQLFNPTKDQRQQNARYLHTLSAASVGGLIGYLHAASTLDLTTVAGAAILASVAIILWYVGFIGMKGE
ncbi:hypothetical protein LJ656_32510 [Paraburkholderia sp. MMS20-SJTR3]|uniref:Uncharacterized protein n=1 Tax=Paraburkholderia sejongensis TaxID=2886946 RepID=A0ABS8K5S9_9BURK|nr:hypothetical protein [Paraburkholderia sp. MMS20-SJTR3]MCC8397299.1 hypothetical protein [Paraburkholderia sp. MMS20-SJTR3]